MATCDRAEDCEKSEGKEHEMGALEAQECGIRRVTALGERSAPQSQRLDHEKDEREEEPDRGHRVHPPELGTAKARPQIEPRGHVEAGHTDEQHGGSSIYDESPLDGGERAHAIGAELASANGRQHDGRHHEDPSDPDDDRQDMQRAGNGKTVHLSCIGSGVQTITGD